MKMAVTRRQRTHGGVLGVEFLTSESPGTPAEHLLQQIQFELAGKNAVGPEEPIAHLFRNASQAIDLRTQTTIAGPETIGMWVPNAQEAHAVNLLSARGFDFH